MLNVGSIIGSRNKTSIKINSGIQVNLYGMLYESITNNLVLDPKSFKYRTDNPLKISIRKNILIG